MGTADEWLCVDGTGDRTGLLLLARIAFGEEVTSPFGKIPSAQNGVYLRYYIETVEAGSLNGIGEGYGRNCTWDG